jgi:hypothetical protein
MINSQTSTRNVGCPSSVNTTNEENTTNERFCDQMKLIIRVIGTYLNRRLPNVERGERNERKDEGGSKLHG